MPKTKRSIPAEWMEFDPIPEPKCATWPIPIYAHDTPECKEQKFNATQEEIGRWLESLGFSLVKKTNLKTSLATSLEWRWDFHRMITAEFRIHYDYGGYNQHLHAWTFLQKQIAGGGVHLIRLLAYPNSREELLKSLSRSRKAFETRQAKAILLRGL